MSITVNRDGDTVSVETDQMAGLDRTSAYGFVKRLLREGETARETARVPGVAFIFTITRED